MAATGIHEGGLFGAAWAMWAAIFPPFFAHRLGEIGRSHRFPPYAADTGRHRLTQVDMA